MTDAISTVEKAAYLALAAAGVVGAPVYSHAPQDTPMPMVIVGDIENVQPVGRADDPDRRMTLSVLVLTEGEERAPCAALLGQVDAALGGKTLTQGTWSVSLTLDSASAMLDEEGLGYVGLAQFSVLALTN